MFCVSAIIIDSSKKKARFVKSVKNCSREKLNFIELKKLYIIISLLQNSFSTKSVPFSFPLKAAYNYCGYSLSLPYCKRLNL